MASPSQQEGDIDRVTLFHFESAEQNKMEKVWRKGEMYVNFAAKPCKCRRYA